MPTKKRITKSKWIDPDDAPPLDRDWFERAEIWDGNKLIRPGRPKKAVTKEAVNIRLDPDVLAHFRATGPGWQTRVNEALRRAARLRPARDANTGR